MKKIVRIEKVNGLGAAVWTGPVDTDYGKAAMQAFIEEHPHDGWTLQFEDSSGNGESVHVLCDTDDMAETVAQMVRQLGAQYIAFSESAITRRYCVALKMSTKNIPVKTQY